jgi:hypothetical protein
MSFGNAISDASGKLQEPSIDSVCTCLRSGRVELCYNMLVTISMTAHATKTT